MKIVFFPQPDETNQYTHLMKSALALAGCEIIWFSFKELVSGKYRDISYFHLNWFENCLWLKTFIYRLLILCLLVILRKKIVFVMHNKRAHADGHAASRRYSAFLMYMLFKYSYRILIHSHESLDYIKRIYHNKTVYVPHPNYINVYGAIHHSMEDKQCLRLLFFGQIRPYKNIELLVESVARFVLGEVFLTIAGQVSSIEYAEKITHKIEGIKNITSHLAFINDNDIPLLLSQYDALIFPYDVQSSLNSGTIILACSYKKMVISAEIGTLKELDSRYFLSYSYKNEKEHSEKLTEIISRAIDMKKINPQIFSDWGEQLYYDIQDNNSLQVVAEHIKQVYAD